MDKLALRLPWNNPTTIQIDPASNLITPKFPASTKLADFINSVSEIALFAGAFLMFFWMAWGVFDYIRAEGNKEALAKARKRIQWAIAGFIILLLGFFISDYLQPLLAPLAPSRNINSLTY